MRFADKRFAIEGCPCRALFYYEDIVKEIILQIKVFRDIELARTWLQRLIPELDSDYRGYITVFAPSSRTSDARRGFNHLAEIFRGLRWENARLLYKTAEYKQSDQKFAARANVADVIAFRGSVRPEKKYLLVDDIVTSQETLKACVRALRAAGVKRLRCLVLAYNCRRLVVLKNGEKVLRLQ